MTEIYPRDNQRPEFEANSTGQMVSHGEIELLSSNKPLHPERVSRVVDILEALNADVVVLEEILEGSLQEVAKQLSDRKAGNYETAYG